MSEEEEESKTIVYLRFPFKRNGFVDPQKVQWSEEEEQKLYHYLLKQDLLQNPNNGWKRIDWQILMKEFPELQNNISFMKQQVFWIYQQELKKLKDINEEKQRKIVELLKAKDKMLEKEEDKKNIEFDFSKLFKAEFNDSILYHQLISEEETNIVDNKDDKEENDNVQVTTNVEEYQINESKPPDQTKINDIISHLQSSRIFASKLPEIKDDNSDEDSINYEEEIEEEEEEEKEDFEDDEGFNVISNPKPTENNDNISLINQIKYLTNKYR